MTTTTATSTLSRAIPLALLRPCPFNPRKTMGDIPGLMASQDTVDARTLLNSLKGLLTIENMGKMKGVLSDADMRILRQASTTAVFRPLKLKSRSPEASLGRGK